MGSIMYRGVLNRSLNRRGGLCKAGFILLVQGLAALQIVQGAFIAGKDTVVEERIASVDSSVNTTVVKKGHYAPRGNDRGSLEYIAEGFTLLDDCVFGGINGVVLQGQCRVQWNDTNAVTQSGHGGKTVGTAVFDLTLGGVDMLLCDTSDSFATTGSSFVILHRRVGEDHNPFYTDYKRVWNFQDDSQHELSRISLIPPGTATVGYMLSGEVLKPSSVGDPSTEDDSQYRYVRYSTYLLNEAGELSEWRTLFYRKILLETVQCRQAQASAYPGEHVCFEAYGCEASSTCHHPSNASWYDIPPKQWVDARCVCNNNGSFQYPSCSAPPVPGTDTDGLSTALILIIVLSTVAGSIVMVFAVWYFCRQRKKALEKKIDRVMFHSDINENPLKKSLSLYGREDPTKAPKSLGSEGYPVGYLSIGCSTSGTGDYSTSDDYYSQNVKYLEPTGVPSNDFVDVNASTSLASSSTVKSNSEAPCANSQKASSSKSTESMKSAVLIIQAVTAYPSVEYDVPEVVPDPANIPSDGIYEEYGTPFERDPSVYQNIPSNGLYEEYGVAQPLPDGPGNEGQDVKDANIANNYLTML
eukprot:Nk52_evm12s277 gene=Nk52_evmTU12s277